MLRSLAVFLLLILHFPGDHYFPVFICSSQGIPYHPENKAAEAEGEQCQDNGPAAHRFGGSGPERSSSSRAVTMSSLSTGFGCIIFSCRSLRSQIAHQVKNYVFLQSYWNWVVLKWMLDQFELQVHSSIIPANSKKNVCQKSSETLILKRLIPLVFKCWYSVSFSPLSLEPKSKWENGESHVCVVSVQWKVDPLYADVFSTFLPLCK